MSAQAAPVPAREHPRLITAVQLGELMGTDAISVRRWLADGLVQGAQRTPAGWIIPTEGLDWLPEPGDRLLSRGKVQEQLAISRRELETWGRNGMLRVYRTPSGHRRYSAAQVQARKRAVSP